jgi:hypothetical protein
MSTKNKNEYEDKKCDYLVLSEKDAALARLCEKMQL